MFNKKFKLLGTAVGLAEAALRSQSQTGSTSRRVPASSIEAEGRDFAIAWRFAL